MSADTTAYKEATFFVFRAKTIRASNMSSAIATTRTSFSTLPKELREEILYIAINDASDEECSDGSRSMAFRLIRISRQTTEDLLAVLQRLRRTLRTEKLDLRQRRSEYYAPEPVPESSARDRKDEEDNHVVTSIRAIWFYELAMHGAIWRTLRALELCRRADMGDWPIAWGLDLRVEILALARDDVWRQVDRDRKAQSSYYMTELAAAREVPREECER